MDPVCHTLVGAALARTGLERRTPLATATLVVGANIPDIDVLAYALDPTWALELRRGWTHGVLALVLWPVVLAGVMLAWDRWVRRRRDPDAVPAAALPLAMLAAIAVLSHPFLDFMNTYGMRWLMPFSGRWFYADVLFIVDPWVWAGLVVGWFAAGRVGERRLRPARIALAGFAVYLTVMAGVGRLARSDTVAVLSEAGAGVPERVMVGPVPVTPVRRAIVAEVGGVYRVGTFDLFRRPRVAMDSLVLPRVTAASVPAEAWARPEVQRFLGWARFPFAEVERDDAGVLVHFGDARYTFDPTNSWAAVTVTLPR